MTATAEHTALRWIWTELGAVVGGVPPAPKSIGSATSTNESLPNDTRTLLRATATRILIDPTTPQNRQMADTAKPAVTDVDVFRTCVTGFIRCQAVALHYESATGTQSERRVQPHGLVIRAPEQSPTWSILGFDVDKRDTRSFRLDRVKSAHFVIGPAFCPMSSDEIFGDAEGIRLVMNDDGSLILRDGATRSATSGQSEVFTDDKRGLPGAVVRSESPGSRGRVLRIVTGPKP